MERIVVGLIVLMLGGAQSFASEAECLELHYKVLEKQAVTDGRQRDEFLFQAAEKGCIAVATDLIAAGAKAHARRRGGETVLHVAAAAGETDMAELLLDHGANMERRDMRGATALFIATEEKRRAMVNLLLARGAKAGAPGRSDTTPLAAAAFNGSVPLVDMLLEAGADPDAADQSGKTPILYAAARGFKPIVERLLSAGVDPNRRYAHDLTLLMWAAGHANDAPEDDGMTLVEFLLGKSERINDADDRGRTALMIAAESGHAQIVRLLIKHGAATGTLDNDGNSANDLAQNPDVKAALAGP